MMAKSLRLTCWSAVFIGVSGSFFAEPLINFVYGSQYGETVLCFQVLIWLVSLAVISGHYMYILIAYNRQWLELFSATCGGIVSIFMNYLLISNYGFIGAAWAVLCSEAFIWSLNYYFVRHEISIIQLWRHLPKPVISGGVMAAVLFLMPGDSLLLKASTAIITYGIGLFILQPGLLNGIKIQIANRN